MDDIVMNYSVKNYTKSPTAASIIFVGAHQERDQINTDIFLGADTVNATIGIPGLERSYSATISIAMVLGVVIVLTITGNVLVIASVAINPHLRTTTYYFIANLAVADLLLGTIVLPFSATLEVLQYWVFGQIFCHVWAAVDVLCCTASILSLCVISIDRYIGVTRPLQHGRIMHRNRTMYVIVFVWLLSTAISVAPLIGWKEDPNPDPLVCTLTTQPGYVLFSASGSFYIPCFIILVVYFRIYRETVKYTRCLMSGAKTAKVGEENVVSLRIHMGRNVRQESQKDNYQINTSDCLMEDDNSAALQHPHNKNSKRNSRLTFSNKVAKFKREKKAAKTLGIVVGVFIICWFPFFIILPIASLCKHCSIPPLLFKMFFWLGYCNSIMNPIIYTCSSMECRRAFKAILSCRRCRRRPRSSLTELQMRAKSQSNCRGRVLRQKQQQFKERDLQYPLCDMSSSSSSPPETLGNVPLGIKQAVVTFPQGISKTDVMSEHRAIVLKDLRCNITTANICSACKSNCSLQNWFYEGDVILHQQFRTSVSVSTDKATGVAC